MRKIFFALIIVVTQSVLTGCNRLDNKVETEQIAVTIANKSLAIARKEYLDDIESYRKDMSDRIETNSKNIAVFKARLDTAEVNKKEIEGLEQRNCDMQLKLDNYIEGGKDKWELFKSKFTEDMSLLNKAFLRLTTK